MTLAHIIYHHEDDGWWAESPEFPSFFAAGDTFEDAKARVREGLPHVAGDTSYLGMIHLVWRGGEQSDPDEPGLQGEQRTGSHGELVLH